MSALHAHCDAPGAGRSPQNSAGRGGAGLLATCVLASGLAFVDGSVVNVGLPAIEADLRADAAALQWVVNAYLLPLGALLLLGGAAGDRYGHRRLLLWGVALFGAASLACAISPNVGALLMARFTQGAAAALMLPSSLALLSAGFHGEARGRAVGIWAASGAALGAVGPLIGGALIDTVSWRAIFLLNLPIAAGAIALALRFAPPDAARRDQRLDLGGGLLATFALGALTFALTHGAGPDGWGVWSTAALALAAAAFTGWALLERRLGERAMTPPSLFASRAFIGLSLTTFLLYGALGAVFVLIPFVLMGPGGFSATAAGAALLPLPAVLAVASPVIGRMAVRWGPRVPLTVGPLIVGAGFLLALRLGEQPAYATELLPMLVVVAFGMSFAVAPLTEAVLGSVDDAHAASASGLNSALARVGGLLATALLGSVLAASGEGLVSRFHVAMAICSVAAVLAGLCAFLTLDAKPAAAARAS